MRPWSRRRRLLGSAWELLPARRASRRRCGLVQNVVARSRSLCLLRQLPDLSCNKGNGLAPPRVAGSRRFQRFPRYFSSPIPAANRLARQHARSAPDPRGMKDAVIARTTPAWATASRGTGPVRALQSGRGASHTIDAGLLANPPFLRFERHMKPRQDLSRPLSSALVTRASILYLHGDSVRIGSSHPAIVLILSLRRLVWRLYGLVRRQGLGCGW